MSSVLILSRMGASGHGLQKASKPRVWELSKFTDDVGWKEMERRGFHGGRQIKSVHADQTREWPP